MNTFRAVIGSNGRLVIPAEIRKELCFKPGDELVLNVDNHELRVMSAQQSLAKARDLFQKHSKGKKVLNDFLKHRREEAGREK